MEKPPRSSKEAFLVLPISFKGAKKKICICILDPSSPTFDLAATLLNQAYRKLLTSTQKDTAKTFVKSMMSSSNDMIDTNEMNSFTSTILNNQTTT